jgi:NADH-quinone oxidoreductase subunit M
MLWMFQRVMFGPVTHPENEKLSDLTLRERLVFAPILILIFWLGLVPQPFIDRMQPSLDRTLRLAQERAVQTQAIGASIRP